jgi:hypothetical protein
MQEQRDRLGQGVSRGSEKVSSPGGPPRRPQRKPRGPGEGPVRCWDCGQVCRVRSGCPSRNTSGKRAAPGESNGSRGRLLSSFHKVIAVPADAPFWVMLQLKGGSIPALIDTGAQFSCVRSDIGEYLYLMGEPCVFGSYSVGCVLADGTRCDLTNSVRLHVIL